MTREEKQLLLKDLCGRVPYVTFVYVDWHETEELEICEDEEEEPNIHTLISCNYYGVCDLDDNLCKTIYDIKPYLRPMSSLIGDLLDECRNTCKNRPIGCSVLECATINTFDWLNAHHFDYRGLIEKGLAIEAPEGMY